MLSYHSTKSIIDLASNKVQNLEYFSFPFSGHKLLINLFFFPLYKKDNLENQVIQLLPFLQKERKTLFELKKQFVIYITMKKNIE